MPHLPRGAVELGDLVAQAAADELAQLEDGLVGDEAAHAVAVLLAADDAGLGEDAEVLGDVLLRRAERVGELVDGHRPVAQRVEQADAHGLADDAEALGDQLDERVRERVGDGCRLGHVHNYTTK